MLDWQRQLLQNITKPKCKWCGSVIWPGRWYYHQGRYWSGWAYECRACIRLRNAISKGA